MISLPPSESVPHWSIAIFSSRETTAELERCVEAAANACLGADATIDVLVNGNRTLADAAVQAIPRLARARPDAGELVVRVFFVPLGDKGHTWNEYVHALWKPAEVTYFVDGYARMRPDAFMKIDRAVRDSPDALAATGVPSIGRSAAKLRAQMTEFGGIHGTLYALTEEAMESIRARRFKLPLGIYRNDAMLGAACALSSMRVRTGGTQHGFAWCSARLGTTLRFRRGRSATCGRISAESCGRLKESSRISRFGTTSHFAGRHPKLCRARYRADRPLAGC